jgi:hypothetical protein
MPLSQTSWFRQIDQHIDIAFWARLTANDRAKQCKMGHAERIQARAQCRNPLDDVVCNHTFITAQDEVIPSPPEPGSRAG